ncbi:MAG: hypothetical protein AAF688_01740 [Bacteroidota bacterium]
MRKITNPLLKINNLAMISSEENTEFKRNDFLQSFNLEFKFIFVVLLTITFCLTGNAQTITNVEPTRVTTGSVVTVTGTGFYPGLENTMRFDPGGYNITGAGSRVYVNPTTMTFVIGQTDGTNRSQNLRFTPSSGTEVETSFTVDYIGPVQKRHRIGTQSDRINPRVEEIYTDYSEVTDFKDGDLIEPGQDYDASQFGKWEFYGLVFNSNPSGVLTEAGGTGRGMFIGFNNNTPRDFVVRGGNGAVGNPTGCAKLVIPPSTYDFSNKIGRLVVTLNPITGELTFGFDEGNTGTFDYQDSVSTGGPFTNNEWSGGDPGAVGRADGGGIAGNETTFAASDFNGQIDGMLFSNSLDSDIAWRSTLGTYTGQPSPPSNPILPDNHHDLLGFKYNGIIYSTGANDALLEFYLGDEVDNDSGPGSEYVAGVFKAYSTNGVQNTTVSQHHIFTGDMLDGRYSEGAFEFLTSSDPAFQAVNGLSMFEVLYDGNNGLNIGTGINNLNQSTTIQFFSGNGEVGTVADAIPDLLIPNMAEAGGTDVYYFTDEAGNIIGTPLAIEINNSDTDNPPLSHWINDQYRVDLGVSFEIAKPSERIYGQIQERPMRLIALKLDDFNIDDAQDGEQGYDYNTSITSIFNINAGAGGTADVPFLAYNGDTFKINSPVVTKRPIPRSVCEADGTANAVFTVEATVDGQQDNPTYVFTPEEDLKYQWFKFNNEINDSAGVYMGTQTNELTVYDIDTNDLGLYKLRISNDFGTTVVSVTIEEGGTRVSWNGTNWNYGPNFRAADDNSPENALKTPVQDTDRRMIMTADRSIGSTEVLEGCSCEVFAGNEITVASGGVLKLFDELNLRQADTIFNPDGVTWSSITPPGKATFENNANLVQMKPVTFNQNRGKILMKRDPISSGLSSGDYIYWSSPVDDFEIGNITGNLTYRWDPQVNNPNGTNGNWRSVNDVDTMLVGRGYIKRFSGETPSGGAFARFVGRPRNGEYSVPVNKSGGGSQAAIESNWNLIGNPYPSAISALKFLLENAAVTGDPVADPTIIEGAVHLWTHQTAISGANSSPFYENFGYNYNGNDYLSKNVTGQNPAATPGNEFYNIASGQGFFVKVLNSAPANSEVVFKNSMRFDTPASNEDPANDGTDGFDNSQFFRMVDFSNEIVGLGENQKMWLTLVNSSQSASSTLVGYINGATIEKDNLYDATTNDSSFGIYSLIGDGSMVIQGRPLPFDESDVVPLGVTLDQNGIYDIAIDKLEGNLFVEQQQFIYLEDTYLNIIHNLRQSPYTFTGETGEINDRFLLRYTNETLSDSTEEITDTFVFINDGQLRVKSKRQINTVEVFDLTGKRVVRHYAARSMELEKDFNHANGIYLASILFSDGTVLNKKLIN